jgi:hypothetical protein
MLFHHILDMTKPIITQAKANVPQGCPHTTTPIVPADDNVPHLQLINREL